MDKTYAPVTTAQELTEALAKCRAAQEKFATYTQEQVDKIFLAAATAANRMRIPLAKQAVAETGMGVVEDKVIKNHYAAEYIYNAYKDSKTCGVIEEDTAYGIQRIAEPIGVIAAVIPTTNPTSTAIFKTLISLKTRNGIIISPHPRAKGCTIAAARVVLEAAVAAGAPEGIIDRLEKGIMEAGPVTKLLLDNDDPESLLRRVMKDFELEILETVPVEYRCYCSRERMAAALVSLGRKQLTELAEDPNGIELTCQFCDSRQRFTPEEIRELLEKASEA